LSDDGTAVIESRARLARSRIEMTMLGLGLCVLCLISLLPAPAGAVVAYPSPETLSDPGQNAGAPQLAIDSAGRATIAWQRFDGAKSRIQALRLGVDGSPGPIQTLSDPGQSALEPQLAIDSAGRATIAWTRSDGANFRIEALRLGVDGSPGPIQTLSDPGQSAFAPQLAIDSDGRATIAWRRFDGANDRIQALRLGVDGSPGPIQTLSDPGAGDPQLAIDSAGRATITWHRFDGANDRIEALRLGVDGSPGPIQTLSDPGQSALEPQLAIDSAGRATITWHRFDGANDRIEALRLGADGSPGPIQTLSDPGQDAGRPQLAIDSDGRATIAWQRFDGANDRIQALRLGADGSPGPIQTLSDPGQDANRPQLAIDSAGRATIAWRRSDGANFRIQALRLGADGSPGPLQTLSDPGQNAFDPQLAIDSDGRATIAWERFDGAKDRIQSVRAEISYPETTIDSGPAEGAVIAEPSPSFGFSSAAPGASFECALDAAAFSACTSPLTLGPLADGPHSFAVRAIDSEEDIDPSPATRSFSVDTAILDPKISAKKTQAQKGETIKLKLKAGAGEPVAGLAKGKITVKGGKGNRTAAKAFKLKKVRKSSAAGQQANYKLKLKRKSDNQRVFALLADGRKLSAKVSLKLTDAAANTFRKRLVVRLKPAKR